MMTAWMLGSLILGQPDDLTQRIEKAIRARGEHSTKGELVQKWSGTRVENDKVVQFTTYRSEDCYREELHWEENGRLKAALYVRDGKQRWYHEDGKTKTFPLESSKVVVDMDYLNEVFKLKCLTDRKRFQLEMIPGIKVGKETCYGVRVKSEGRKDVDLYITSDTQQLRKVAAKKLGADGAYYDTEFYFSDYKVFDGVSVPMKEKITVVTGEYTSEEELKSVEFIPAEKARDLFKKP